MRNHAYAIFSVYFRCILLLQLCPEPNPLLGDVEKVPAWPGGQQDKTKPEDIPALPPSRATGGEQGGEESGIS